jgi:hypothetical protein
MPYVQKPYVAPVVHRAFEKLISVQYLHQDLPLGPSDIFFRGLILRIIQSYFKGVGHVLQKRLMARRVRPDQRWETGVGARGG